MTKTHEAEQTAVASQNCEQIRINPACKLELIASKDETRRPLQSVKIEYSERFKRNVAVSTNGRSMAIVPLETPAEENKGYKVKPYLVSVEALKASRSQGSKHSPLNGLMTLNGNIELADNRSFPLPEQDQIYPNWERVLPTEREKIKFSIALNPQFLLDCAKAIGSADSVRLDFIDEMSPIQIRGSASYSAEPDARAVLMPMRIS